MQTTTTMFSGAITTAFIAGVTTGYLYHLKSEEIAAKKKKLAGQAKKAVEQAKKAAQQAEKKAAEQAKKVAQQAHIAEQAKENQSNSKVEDDKDFEGESDFEDSYETESDYESDEDLFVPPEIPLSQLAPHDESRMALIVRTDLGMEKGKAAAQCAHAALACYKATMKYDMDMLNRWEHRGQAKITLKCRSQEEMDELFAKAISLGIVAKIIHDAGRTQIAAGSATVLGLGPAPKSVLDEITGKLKLY
ncbi:PTH2-domain-containing protein [Nadsonia fulvescens var. elongata DSM 6958]|uniref:peptidyl-tRNA hydrolase n=1 Tax=Nadsonia fulvescens var. elongata DSM 6958 TaxID=857566 RepID=A0A1E3PK62_9ASCO|nr:PTH2-domain-containing protein [Nadsonia fulvescens var. elongata DSM 6958]